MLEEPPTLRRLAKQKSSAKRRSRWVLITLGMEATLHFVLSVKELVTMERVSKKDANTPENSLSRKAEITIRNEPKDHLNLRTIFEATMASIAFDLSYNLGVAVGSWREKLLPISKR